MNIRPPHLTSKFVNTYSKLFQGIPPGEIAPGQDADRFYSDLLDLKVDRLYLEGELKLIPKEVCREKLKVRIATSRGFCLLYSIGFYLVAFYEFSLQSLHQADPLCEAWRLEETARTRDAVLTGFLCPCQESDWLGNHGSFSRFRRSKRRGFHGK